MDTNPIRYSDLVAPDNSIEELIDQLDELVAKYDSAKQKIQGAAADVAKSLQGVSGATEDQRKAIQMATEQSDKLVTEYRDVSSAAWKATQAFAEATAAKKESARVDKLITQINTSAEGSYNRLSAQYRLNKIRLNEMSLAEREGTEAGRALEAETKAIYEEMKRLQESTGKHTLNVGNYADAAKGLRQELMSLTQQMAYMKANGEGNSEEYQKMAERAGQLKDAMVDAQTEVRAMASDTQQLDTAMGAASAASGGMSAVTGTLALMGTRSETATEAQKELGAAVGIVSGLTAVQNALQKESNLMTGIRVLQTRAATKAEQLDTAAKTKNTAATVGATVAQRIFNAVAKANPYVLLAMALITVVGALVAFAVGANRATKEQNKLNKSMAAQLDYMEVWAQEATRGSNERIEALERELEIAKARNASMQEIRAIEDQIYQERVKAHDKQMEIYADELANLDLNRTKLLRLQKTLLELQQAQARGQNKIRVDVDLDGRIERVKVDKAIEAVQGQIDNYGRSVDIAVGLKTEGAGLATQRAVQLQSRRKETQQQARAENDILRGAEDARIALMRDGFEKEKKELRTQAERRMQDLKTRLDTDKTLTKNARKAIAKEIKDIREKYYKDLAALTNKYTLREIQTRRETEDAEVALMQDGAEKQRRILYLQYSRQIQDLRNTLVTQKDLTEAQVDDINAQIDLAGQEYFKKLADLDKNITIDQMKAQADRLQLRLDGIREGDKEELDLTLALMEQQRQIELAENAALTESLRKNEADINAKWDRKVIATAAELSQKRAEVLLSSQNMNDRQRAQFELKMRRDTLRRLLELDADAGYQMTQQARQNIENTIAAIELEAKKMPYDSLWEVLGIGVDSAQQSALDTAIDSVVDSLSSVIDSWNQVAEAAVEAANAQVEAAQQALDAEIAARNAGYANEVATAQKELELAKKSQEQALREKEKAQKAQIALDTTTQASSLVTASANLWSALSPLPGGVALATAAIATMWGSFAAAKIKAVEVTKKTEQYGEGTVELLQGGSHASGHDIDLGMKPDGTRRRAEGGEYFAVINKRNSRRYGRIIPDVINAFNDGTFADKYQKANATMSNVAFGLVGGHTDVSELERDVAAIRKQGDRMQYTDGQGNIIIRYKNLTRKIYKN